MALGKRVRTVFCIFLLSILLLTLFPFYIVFGENEASYTIIDSCTKVARISWQRKNNFFVNVDHPCRAICILYQNSDGYVVFISDSSFKKYSTFSNDDVINCGVPSENPQTFVKNGVTYYFHYGLLENLGKYFLHEQGSGNDCYISYVWHDSNIAGDFWDEAYYYTYGAGSVDPVEPVNFGDLIIDGYSTDVAGQGEASINNIDHIKWNGYVDSNGNDISNCKVRLQIIPGQYTGTSKNDLSNKTRQDFVIDPINASESLFNATDGEIILSWREIVNRIDIIPYRLYSLELLGPDWKKDGWIYKLRLEDEDNDYIGEWQTVYSSTANGVENDLVITNNTTINQTLIQTFQELNSINNVENNWVFNNTEISVENNYTEPSSGQKPWWAYLLESILNTFNVTNNYINNGNEGTQTIVDTVNDSDDDLNDKLIDYHTYEDDFINDMEDNLSDIEVETDLFEDNKFITSANWVATQYTRMTNNNVIGSLIGFSLLLGLALIFIGKIR